MSVLMVLANIRVQPVGWPLAIGSAILYALLFLDSRLYGQAALQLVFVGVALWGWHRWGWSLWPSDGQRSAPAEPVRQLPRVVRSRLLAVGVVAWLAVGTLLGLADGVLPWLDALPTAGSLIGQWLLGRKYVENWPVWIGVNLVSVALFAWQGLWMTTALYALFTALAWTGWHRWRQLAAETVAS